MKTAVFILAGCLLITISLSAQTNQELKPDSTLTSHYSFQNRLSDTLKLHIPLGENNFQAPARRYDISGQEQKFALNSHPFFRMPIYRPEFESKMPVKKPGPSVHYFLQIKKNY